MKKLKSFFVGLLSFLLSMNVAFAGTATLQGINVDVGTWIWNSDLIQTDPNQVISFLKQNSANEAYLQIKRAIPMESYKSFIKLAGENGIRVYALDGGSTWATPEGFKYVDSFFKWVGDYQTAALENERFSGIHLDVEPYLNQIWKDDLATGILYYQQYTMRALGLAKQLNLSFGADLPFWFDARFYSNEFGSGNLAEWTIQQVDSVNLMSYRDTAKAIIPIVETEINYGKLYNKKVVVSVNTMKSSEGKYTTFFEEGRIKMNQELLLVQNSFTGMGYNYGFAIHSYATWASLKD